MSMCICALCSSLVDTDNDGDSLYVIGYKDKCVCESCRENNDLATEFDNAITPEGLKSLRLSLGLTQIQMAAKLGIRHRMYCYVEKGIKPLSTASTILANQLLEAHRQKSPSQ